MTNFPQAVEIEQVSSNERPTLGEVPAIEKPPQPAGRLRVAIWTGIVGVVAISAVVWLLPAILRKPLPNIVAASGRIEGREVTLAPKEIQGRVKTLLVDEGASVKKGQLVAELESNQLDARFASLAANVANLDAQIRQASVDVGYATKSTTATIAAAESAVSSAEARLARARAILANAYAEYQRAQGLFASQVNSQSALDQATMNYEAGQADVNAAEKDVAQAQANLAVAYSTKDTVELKTQQLRALQQGRRGAVSQMEEARANLAERMIYAPTDGTILSRPVEVGDVVSPGSPIFVMVNMSRLYLKVYIPEPDIPKLKLGDPADIAVDAFPGRTFPARITKIFQDAEFTPKNVETKEERVKLVFGVELTFVQPEGSLKPGMPADCTIHWTKPVAPSGTKPIIQP
jgi:HlyD family secretion protein